MKGGGGRKSRPYAKVGPKTSEFLRSQTIAFLSKILYYIHRVFREKCFVPFIVPIPRYDIRKKTPRRFKITKEKSK